MMRSFLKNLFLPIFLAWYPVIFLYNRNVTILELDSLYKPLLVFLILVLALYGAMVFLFKKDFLLAGLATSILLIFFYLYGWVYDTFMRVDLVTIKHYTLLPFMLVLGLYVSGSIAVLLKKHAISVQKVGGYIISGLVIVNLIGIIPTELKKASVETPATPISATEPSGSTSNYPDIYFFVFDEFAGFNSMRSYWKYTDIDDFSDFLKGKGFYVSEKSKSETISTLTEISNRLNFEEYQTELSEDVYFEAITENDVMLFLKSRGYSIVVFDGARSSFAYPSKPPISADFAYEFDSTVMDEKGVAIDEFGQMVFNLTMLRPAVETLSENNPTITKHRSAVLYTFEKVANLDEVPTPKLVYVHVLLPHMPFIFDANGNMVDAKYHQNWNYYLGHYIYSTKLIRDVVNRLQENADPKRPPIIILQSDHGARNKKTGHPDSVNFPDFPEELKHDIMVAMNIPGYDYSKLPSDFKPDNTFPLLFNYLFGADIPLR